MEENLSNLQNIPTPISERNPQLIMFMLTNQIIDEVEHNLRGEILTEKYDKASKQFIVVYEKTLTSLINNEGINQIIYTLKLKLTHSITLSNFTEFEIQKKMTIFTWDLIELLVKNLKTFEIKPENWKIIANGVIDIVHANFNRAIIGENNEKINILKNALEHKEIVENRFQTPVSLRERFKL
jgi:hypothetical protein